MKARVTADQNNLLAKEFTKLFDCDFYSRSTGFDITNKAQREAYLENTSNYNISIHITNGGDFSAANLLCDLENYCYESKIDHKVFSIGSYICFSLINAPQSKYPIEKAALKFAHERIVNSYVYHQGYLDSYLINLNFIKGMSNHIEKHYKHLSLLSLKDIRKNIEFMLNFPHVKELSLQSKQPGNHRINDGIGPVFPGSF